jgi:uncharacterized delta-60 repeat protein
LLKKKLRNLNFLRHILSNGSRNMINKTLKSHIQGLTIFLVLLIVFTACHKKKKPFLLLPLMDGGSGGSGSIFIPARGEIDDSFNSSGYQVLEVITGNHGFGQSLGIQSNGKILLGGYCGNTAKDFCIVRFKSDGSIDTNFGSSGKVITNDGDDDYALSLKVLSDDRIMLGGYCDDNIGNNYFCYARYGSDGTYQTSGYMSISASLSDYAMSLVVESMEDKFNPGKFLLGGYCNDQFCLARLDFSGSFDTSFNSSGYVIKNIPTASDIGRSLALQSDGKILLGGTCDNRFCIARFNSDGSLDTVNFGSPNGYVVQDISTGSDNGNSLVLQPDGKILLGGTCDNKFCVARFNSDGSSDTTFGTGGYFILDIPSSNPDNARSLLLQPDGKILLGGFCFTGGIQKFCIARIK